MNPYQAYRSLVKQAYEPNAQFAIENPFEYVQQNTGGATLRGAGWGAGIGAIGGAVVGAAMAPGHSLLPAVAGGALGYGAFGGLLGGMIGRGMAVDENWRRHAAIVRKHEAEHGPLPYELHNPRQLAELAEMKGMAGGMMVDTLASGNIYGVSNDRRGINTYGTGRNMGHAIGHLEAKQQFNRALAEYKREQHNKSR